MSQEHTSTDPLVGQVFEKCRILSRIARGGMGVVYLAEHTGLRRRVALKVLPEQLARDREYVARFRREGIAAARLDHPNIVQVYDVGEHAGLPFIVLQYVEGFTLAEIVERSGRLEPKEAARIGRDVARALAAAHAQGIVHRDVKPENVLVSENGEVRLTDFGVALDPAQGEKAGGLVGTPHYISPEQAEGRVPDARSDLYSLGATLYAAITGRTPFQGDTAMAVLYKHRHEAPRRPGLFAKNLPFALEEVILKLLAKDPARRYGSAKEVEDELDKFLRGLLVKPRPKSEPARALPPRRRKLPAATIGFVAAAVLVLGVGLAALFSGEMPPPSPEPAAAPDPVRAAAQRAEERGELEAALDLYRRVGDSAGAARIEERLRRAKETAQPAPPPPQPAPAPETGFAPLYRGRADARLWTLTPALEKAVFFLDDGILVSFPTANTEPDQVEHVALNYADFEEFLFRFDLRAEAAPPAVCFGLVLRGDAGFPGRSAETRVPLAGLALKAWHSLQLEVRGGQYRLTSGVQTLASGSLSGGASLFGRVGWACRPGADFQVKNPRVLVRKRTDLTRLVRGGRPSVKAAPATGARGVREEVLARAATALYDGGSLEGWQVEGPARVVNGHIEVQGRGARARLLHRGIAAAQGLSFEVRVRAFHSERGAGLLFNRGNALFLLRERVVLAARDGEGWKTLATRPLVRGPERWMRVELFEAGGRVYLFMDGELLWEGASEEPHGLGRDTGLVAEDADCDFRAVAVYGR